MTDRMTDDKLDELIRRELVSVSAPIELRQKLLQPELLAAGRNRDWFNLAANDGLFYRLLPVAASLVAALGIALWSSNNGHAALEQEIFAHMYMEAGALTSTAVIALPAVNLRMEDAMGAHLEMSEAVANLEVTFAKDCWVAKGVAFHMVMKGKTGAVTVMMIPSTDFGNANKDAEFNISDAEYSGLVTPTDGGYLVVVGNKQEPIAEYRNLLAGNLDWEY